MRFQNLFFHRELMKTCHSHAFKLSIVDIVGDMFECYELLKNARLEWKD